MDARSSLSTFAEETVTPVETRPKRAAPPSERAAAAERRIASPRSGPRRVCLVGAGNIAAVHAEALQAAGFKVAVIVDPNLAAARRLAERAPGCAVHATAAAALSDIDTFDAAHVLAPPALHCDAALPFIEAGFPTLVEKPLATSHGACEQLISASERSGATVGVNQNFVFHPAFARLRRRLASGAYGRLRFIDCIYHAPLRQLAARQFGHWMFDEPGNLLLEQAVHPLSQIIALAGPVQDAQATAAAPLEFAPGRRLFPEVTSTLTCERARAQLRFAVGQSFPFWQVTAVCDDGVLVADIYANRSFAHGRTRWMEAIDALISGGRTGAAILGDSVRNAADYGLSTLRLKPRSDAFFLSMRGSIGAFHAAVAKGARPELDAGFGAAVVAGCEAISRAAFGVPRAPSRAARVAAPTARRSGGGVADVAVLGGTGFIGQETVRRLLKADLRVAVMARSTHNLPAVFADERVSLHRGDIRELEQVRDAIGGAPVVVNLAHGGGGGDFAQVRAAMVGGAEAVATACAEWGVRRLVHVSSIASLYLGPQRAAVSGGTPADARSEARADYARAKAECERLLLHLHARERLPVCILRPGLVVGEGTSPFHSGLGFFNNDQHCIGWNDGRNPLPFVLVQDVAEAIGLAVQSEAVLEGRCYNLVGDVRLSARAYLTALAKVTGRPLAFHPSDPTGLWAQELAKWMLKRLGGRRAPLPSRHDILSRGLAARFDCADVKGDLGWRPVADPATFARLALEVHA